MTCNRWYQKHSEPGPVASSGSLFKALGILTINDIYKPNIAEFIFSSLSNFSNILEMIF